MNSTPTELLQMSFSEALQFLINTYDQLLAPLATYDGDKLTYDECRALVRATNSRAVFKAMQTLRGKLLAGREQGVNLEPWEIANALAVEVAEEAERTKSRPRQSVPRHHHSWKHKERLN
jgi:hypothetical protein